MQHDFRVSSKMPVLVRAWQKYFLSAQSNFNYRRKVLSKKSSLINIKKSVRQNPCCVGSLLHIGIVLVNRDLKPLKHVVFPHCSITK